MGEIPENSRDIRKRAKGVDVTYNLKITEIQAIVIQEALEVYARLGIGQFRDALEKLPLIEWRNNWHDDLYVIGAILKKHMIGNVDGWQSSLGITSADVSGNYQVAWDIYQVIRRKLAWARAVENGVVESESSPRNWSIMMRVSYDDVMQTGAEELAIMEDLK